MIDFNTYVDLIQQSLEETTYGLYNNSKIEHPYHYYLYSNSNNTSYDIDSNSIVGVIYDNGITRDETSSISTSLQDIDVDLMIDEYYADDLSIILNEYANNNKNKPLTIDGYTAICIITLSHDQYTKTSFHENYVVKTKINIKYIVVDGYYLSDNIVLKINDDIIPFNTITSTLETETLADLTIRKNGENRVFANSSIFGMNVVLPMSKNSTAITRIIADLYKGSYFGEPVIVSLYEKGDEENTSKWFINKDAYLITNIQNVIKIGSVASITIQLNKYHSI